MKTSRPSPSETTLKNACAFQKQMSSRDDARNSDQHIDKVGSKRAQGGTAIHNSASEGSTKEPRAYKAPRSKPSSDNNTNKRSKWASNDLQILVNTHNTISESKLNRLHSSRSIGALRTKKYKLGISGSGPYSVQPLNAYCVMRRW